MNSKKPVIIYFHRYPIEYEAMQYSGMEDLLNILKKKYSVIYLSMKGYFPANNILRKGVKIEQISLRVDTSNGKDKWIKTAFYYLLLPLTLLRIKKLNPDFVICKETLPFVPYFIGKLKIPMMIDISDWWWSILFGKTKIGRFLAQFLENFEVKMWNNFNPTLVVHSSAEADLVKNKGFYNHKIVTVNAPMKEGIYFPIKKKDNSIRHKLNLNKKKWVVAVHGILHPSKGYDQLLDWWKKISKIYPNWILLIIGGAGGEKTYRKKIEKINVGKNVIMTGWLPTQSDVNLYLNNSDCLLVTRRNTPENKGVMASSLYHSLSVGKPTVAVNLPGMAEIIKNGRNGYLFEPDNFESFKSVLKRVYLNKKESLKVAKNGLKRASECFNSLSAAKKYKEIVDKSINISL